MIILSFELEEWHQTDLYFISSILLKSLLKFTLSLECLYQLGSRAEFGQKNPQRGSGTPKFCNFCFCCKIVFSKMGVSTLLAEKFYSLVFEGALLIECLQKGSQVKFFAALGRSSTVALLENLSRTLSGSPLKGSKLRSLALRIN